MFFCVFFWDLCRHRHDYRRLIYWRYYFSSFEFFFGSLSTPTSLPEVNLLEILFFCFFLIFLRSLSTPTSLQETNLLEILFFVSAPTSFLITELLIRLSSTETNLLLLLFIVLTVTFCFEVVELTFFFLDDDLAEYFLLYEFLVVTSLKNEL